MLRSQARHESVLNSTQNKDLLAKKILLMVETTCGSTEKLGNGKRPTAWLLLQLNLVIFLLSRNLRKTCMVGLVLRAPHRAVVYHMVGVTTIEIEAIVRTMLSLSIRLLAGQRRQMGKRRSESERINKYRISRRDGSGSCNRSGPEPIRFRLAVA